MVPYLMINLKLFFHNFSIEKNKSLEQKGFTLIEVAVVLVVVGLLLGSILGPLASQERNRKIKLVETSIEEIKEALIGYAAINGNLPCPAPASYNPAPPAAEVSRESRAAGAGLTDCLVEHGYVPSITLNINGLYNPDKIYVDPWGTPYYYSLNDIGTWEYAKTISPSSPVPTFNICDTAGCPANSEVATGVVAVIYSLGPLGFEATTSPDQLENTNDDDNFVSRAPSEGNNTEFDDLVTWLTTNELILNLVKSGQISQ